MNTKVRTIVALLALTLVIGLASLVGCGGPGPTPNESPVQTPATGTSTPPPSPTPSPTDAQARPTATPQVSPTPEWPPYTDAPFAVVYMRDCNLWVSEVGGQGERRLTNDGLCPDSGRPTSSVTSFSVSPDGEHIVYVVSGQSVSFVKIVNVLNGSTRLISPASNSYGVIDYGFPGPQAWWDETHVAYYTLGPQGAGEDMTRWADLVIVDLETGQRTVEPVSAVQFPSPDGRYVLSGLQLHDRETGERWEVIEASIDVTFLGWSPTSRLMLFELPGATEASGLSGLRMLLVVDAETRAEWVVTPEDGVARSGVWSPDGQSIAYRQCAPPYTGCENPELWLTSLDGVNRRRIESIYGSHIAWTPDGTRLVLETDLEPAIWSLRLDGTDLRPIADGYNPQVLR